MSKIPELLRQLADEFEQTEAKLEAEWITQKDIIEDKLTDVNTRAHRSEDKLQRIGKILMED